MSHVEWQDEISTAANLIRKGEWNKTEANILASFLLRYLDTYIPGGF